MKKYVVDLGWPQVCIVVGGGIYADGSTCTMLYLFEKLLCGPASGHKFVVKIYEGHENHNCSVVALMCFEIGLCQNTSLSPKCALPGSAVLAVFKDSQTRHNYFSSSVRRWQLVSKSLNNPFIVSIPLKTFPSTVMASAKRC